MRRLKNVYPGDLVKWPNKNGQFDIGAAGEGSKILFYNETPINIDLDFENGSSDVLHAWEANFWILDGDTTQINWQIDADSLNVVNPPINAVFSTIYNPEERLNDKAYPMPLIRQIGGQQAIVSSASTVVNDGNALLQVIEATLQGHSSSDVIINNDGSFTLKGAGLLGAVAVLTHVLGTLTVDQATTLSGALQVNAVSTLGDTTNKQGATVNGPLTATGAIALAAVTALTHVLGELDVDGLIKVAANFQANNVTNTLGQYIFKDNAGNPLMTLDQNGLTLDPASTHMKSYGISLRVGSLTRISIFSGTGTGTFNHNLGSTPDIVIPMMSVSGSQTMGYDTLTSTTVHITTGAGLAWTALALKL